MSKKSILINSIVSGLLFIICAAFYMGERRHQLNRNLDLQDAVMLEQFKTEYCKADIVCLVQRKHIFFAKPKTALVDYQILKVIKGAEITVGDHLLLQYWNDSPSWPGFKYFVSDKNKELILQIRDETENIYKIEGDGFITYFIDKSLINFLSQLKSNDSRNLQEIIEHTEISQAHIWLR